jgi:hypothetical protein
VVVHVTLLPQSRPISHQCRPRSVALQRPRPTTGTTVDITPTRLALHGAAELLLAGPQYAVSGTIRLRVVPGGIATVAEPDLRVEGTDLVGAHGRHPLRGSYSDVAAAAGIAPRRLDDVYRDGVDVSVDDPIYLDSDHVATLLDGLAVGEAALRALAPDEVPVLWPEHFDVAATEDEVTYGVSAGDNYHPTPYAYIGPWTQRTGPFWNAPFGALYPLDPADDVDALTPRIADFFQRGRRELSKRP